MLPRESLKELVHRTELNRAEKLLLCLAVDASQPKSVAEIRKIASSAGLRAASRWNVSAYLARSAGRAIRTDVGWELTNSGHEHVRKLAGALVGGPVPVVAASLRGHLARISAPEIAAFVEEAIKSFEARLYRAAVVLSWVGALSLLYNHVIDKHLSAFNAEALRRDNKWRQARTRDDLARMKEKDFLDILEGLSIVGKSVKQELETCLRLRNGCGHPNSLVIAENRAAGHIEALVLNVFTPFA